MYLGLNYIGKYKPNQSDASKAVKHCQFYVVVQKQLRFHKACTNVNLGVTANSILYNHDTQSNLGLKVFY